jgi:hypothetical protein
LFSIRIRLNREFWQWIRLAGSGSGPKIKSRNFHVNLFLRYFFILARYFRFLIYSKPLLQDDIAILLCRFWPSLIFYLIFLVNSIMFLNIDKAWNPRIGNQRSVLCKCTYFTLSRNWCISTKEIAMEKLTFIVKLYLYIISIYLIWILRGKRSVNTITANISLLKGYRSLTRLERPADGFIG